MTETEQGSQASDNPPEQAMPTPDGQFPIDMVITDDLKRSRLTVLFRLLLVIPAFIWLMLWGFVAFFALVANWVATTIKGQSPDSLHNFLAGYIRYTTHILAYYYILADPYPGFSSVNKYPVTVDIAPPAKQGRLGVFFRGILAIPAYFIASILRYVLGIIVILNWLIALFTGRLPRGFEDIGLYILRYEVETLSYYSLLTNRYPRLST